MTKKPHKMPQIPLAWKENTEAMSCCYMAFQTKWELKEEVVDGEKNLVGVMGSVVHYPINEQYFLLHYIKLCIFLPQDA